MIEVAIASVEAVFDWKAFLKSEFGYDVDPKEMEEEMERKAKVHVILEDRIELENVMVESEPEKEIGISSEPTETTETTRTEDFVEETQEENAGDSEE